MGGPFEGIRVLDLTQIIAGPFGCMMLADMGADVIKVEPPGGESWRVIAQFMPLESKTFQSLNRGKRSLVLKLDDPRGQEVVHRLIPSIDVVVTNYRPDVPARLKIDYPTLSAIKPDLIYIDNTAFGRRGPLAQKPGYDIVAQAVTGLMVTDGKVDANGVPRPASPAIADFSTGLTIAWAASTALFHRERTGEGQLVQTSLLATALALQGGSVMVLPMADAAREKVREKRRELQAQNASFEELTRARRPAGGAGLYYRAFLTKDGALAIGALSKALRAKVRRAVGTEFLGRDDPNFDANDPDFRDKSRAASQEVEVKMLEKTTAEWLEILEREGVPAGRVKFPDDMSEDEQVLANDMIVELEHELSGPQKMVAPILKFGDYKPQLRASPALGSNTDECLREAGYAPEQIEELRRDGVVA